MTTTKKGHRLETLNDRVIYAAGFNDGIAEVVKIILSRNCGECDMSTIYLKQIMSLDKSMQATDD